MQNASITFTKIRSTGDWGVLVDGTHVQPGLKVTVFKKSGGTTEVTLDQKVGFKPGKGEVWSIVSDRKIKCAACKGEITGEYYVYHFRTGRATLCTACLKNHAASLI